MIRKIVLFGASALILGLGAAHAQDYTLTPTAGSVKLAPGFAPDPLQIDVDAGGPTDLSKLAGATCNGFVAAAPTYRVFYTAGDAPLVISATADVDTVLLVNDPNGVWTCDDDAGPGVNPQLTVDAPLTGQYDIWVGTYSVDSAGASASLSISGASPATNLDYTLTPDFGTVTLTSGFTPDPNTTDVTAGGVVEVAQAGIGDNCYGYATAEPTLRLQYTAGSYPLYISAISDTDTVLAVNGPDGTWTCDDDSAGGLNPSVMFQTPQSGQYDVWVATYGGGTASATVQISELSGAATTPPDTTVGQLDYTIDPAFGTQAVSIGFMPDPMTIPVTAGGDIDVTTANAGDGCYGYATAGPTFRLNYTSGSLPLYIGAESTGDTVLIVNGPDGTWTCDDDTGGNLNPRVSFPTPASGQYDIWVGTYDGGTIDATLTLSETAPVATTSDAVDGTLRAIFGDGDLVSGFDPDPFLTTLDAGGPIAASSVDDSCTGFVTAAPSYHLHYDAGSYPLIISAESTGDTTLLVQDPDGHFLCDDDSAGGLNPAITITAPSSGDYQVWVGTYAPVTEDNTTSATLYVSEIAAGAGQNAGDAQQLDYNLDPVAGTQDLSTGFSPDPFTVDVNAGGTLDAQDAAAAGCRGHVTAGPTFRLNYTAGSAPLGIWVTADADTTLVISDPQGNWVCSDDDGDGLNPAILFNTPASGQYDIWVGTYGEAASPATLSISETTDPLGADADTSSGIIVSPMPPRPSNPPVAPASPGAPAAPASAPASATPPATAAPVGGLDPSLDPGFGAATLAAGFTPDPQTADVTAGGTLDATDVGAGCDGFVTAAPTYRLTYDASTWPFFISATSAADTALVVHTPDGQWICDDDGGDGTNPLVEVPTPTSGVYDIWVGTYRAGPTQAATLSISEIAG